MSLVKKRVEKEQVNISIQKILERGIVRGDLILERSFFLFALS